MAGPKPKTAEGYSAPLTDACEMALVNLLRGFGTLKDSFRLIGGLVPRYLTPECADPFVPPHAGTRDVDVVLNLQVLAEAGAYASLGQQMRQLGFERGIGENGRPVTWRWRRRVSGHEVVDIEFLKDPLDQPGSRRVQAIAGEDLAACNIDHCGIVQEWYLEREVTAPLFTGGLATEPVRYADLVAFILLKALACDQRAEPKDVGDLIHVLRYAGPLAATAAQFAGRMAGGRHSQVFAKALAALRRRFGDGPGVQGHERDGPAMYASFLHAATDSGLDDERARARLFAAGLVGAFLEEVERRLPGVSPATASN